MTRRIPIRAAKTFATEQGLNQVIIVGWDGKRMHVITYGKTLEDCEQAADGGNFVKKALGFPTDLCNSKPARVGQLERKKLKLAKKRLQFEKIGETI